MGVRLPEGTQSYDTDSDSDFEAEAGDKCRDLFGRDEGFDFAEFLIEG